MDKKILEKIELLLSDDTTYLSKIIDATTFKDSFMCGYIKCTELINDKLYKLNVSTHTDEMQKIINLAMELEQNNKHAYE